VSPKGDALMKADGQALDALCNSSTVTYNQRVDNLSSMKADRKLKYLVVTYSEINIGTWGDVSDYILRVKDARTKGGLAMDVDYYRPSNSGIGNAYASVRYVEKLEELDATSDFSEVYDKVHGNNEWYKDWSRYISMVKQTKTEIRVLRTDLSSL
jgi:hypothetical protein